MIKIGFRMDFMQKRKIKFFTGLTRTFVLIFELLTNKTQLKINNITLPHNFAQLNEFCQKMLIFFEKGVSGLPYLLSPPWKFCKIHTKFKHLGSLVQCNHQNSLKPK